MSCELGTGHRWSPNGNEQTSLLCTRVGGESGAYLDRGHADSFQLPTVHFVSQLSHTTIQELSAGMSCEIGSAHALVDTYG